jgi:hypothetical protein
MPRTSARRALVADFNFVQAVFDRSALVGDEDVAVMTMHCRKIIDNFPDFAPMDEQAREDFWSNFHDFWTQVADHVSVGVTCKELRFYDVPTTPGTDMGDPVEVKAIDVAGTATSAALPPQVSCSVTWKTEKRKQWGRFYIPGLTAATLQGNGYLQDALCDEIALAAKGLTFRGGTGAALVVFSRIHWNHLDPTEVQVDNVLDVIRRRRFSRPTYRAVLPAS